MSLISKSKRKPVSTNSGMRSVVISLPKCCTSILEAQELIAIQLYNRALYLLRNNFFYHEHLSGKPVAFDVESVKFPHKYPSFESVYHAIKDYEQYSILPSQVAQNLVKLAIEGLNSFKGLVKAKATGKLAKDTKIRLPMYKKVKDEDWNPFLKSKLRTVEMTYDRGNFVKKGCELSLTPSTLDGVKQSRIVFNLPKSFKDMIVNTVTIKRNGIGYLVHVAYRKEGFLTALEGDRLIGVDLGVNNLATTINAQTGESLLFDGRFLKSVNRYYNKKTALLKSKMDLEKEQTAKDKYFKRIQKTTVKRNRSVRDYMHKVARRIARYAFKNNINKVVVGYNEQWKTSVNMGSKTNQNFTNIPYRKLLDNLTDKCFELGISVITTEESYTSKVDHLALEPLCKQEAYLGKRKKRGLFQSSVNQLINADVNGAIGILRKCMPDSLISEIRSSGRFFRPVKIQVYP